MQRWMARAAGGTSQRLKPGFAKMFSRERKPGFWPVGLRSRVVLKVRPPTEMRRPLSSGALVAIPILWGVSKALESAAKLF